MGEASMEVLGKRARRETGVLERVDAVLIGENEEATHSTTRIAEVRGTPPIGVP